MTTGSWLENTHPKYKAKAARWEYAADHYSGDVLDKLATYLVKKAVGEAPAAYDERCKIAKFPGHYSAVIDSLVGMAFAVEEQANHRWANEAGQGLGDPQDQTSLAAQLASDFDGDGSNRQVVLMRAAAELIVKQTLWVYPEATADGTGRVRLIAPEAVVDWDFDEAGLAWAKIRELVVVRDGMRGAPQEVEQFLVVTRDGWERWRSGDSGDALVGNGAHAFVDRAGRPVCPIRAIALPLERPVGYMLARDHNALMNAMSELQWQLRGASFSLLEIDAADADFKAVVEALAAGGRAIQRKPGSEASQFLAPSSESAATQLAALQEGITQFYITAFKSYGDAARTKTAAEVGQDVAGGVGAFLTLLVSALDQLENFAYDILGQALLPGNKAAWFQANIERSREFGPMDLGGTIDKMVTQTFGTGTVVPLGRSAQIAAAKQVAGFQGLPANELEIAAEIDATQLLRLIGARAQGLPIPASALAEISIRLLETAGLLGGAGTVTMADGTKVARRAQLLAEATALAAADEAGQLRQAEFARTPLGEPDGDAGE